MLNRVTIMGRIANDVELRTTPSGTPVTSFTVCVDRSYVKAGEERQTDFINVVCWKQTAEFVCRYFQKGNLIAVDGKIQTRNYEDKDGKKRTATEVIADEVSFCGGKNESTPAVETPKPSVDINADGNEGEKDELPF